MHHCHIINRININMSSHVAGLMILTKIFFKLIKTCAFSHYYFFLFSATDQPHPWHFARVTQQTPKPTVIFGEGSGGVQELPARWPGTQDKGSTSVSTYTNSNPNNHQRKPFRKKKTYTLTYTVWRDVTIIHFFGMKTKQHTLHQL